jgi:hypothetical protein
MERELGNDRYSPDCAGRSRLGMLLEHHNVDTQKAVESAGQLIAFAFETCIVCHNAEHCEPLLEAGCDVRIFCPNADVLAFLPKHQIN